MSDAQLSNQSRWLRLKIKQDVVKKSRWRKEAEAGGEEGRIHGVGSVGS